MKAKFEITQDSYDSCMLKMASLSGKEMKSVNKKALRRGANLLVRETRKTAKSMVPALASKSRFKADGGKSYLQGVRVSKTSDDKQAKVHIMGHFLLRIFELGTESRYIRGNSYSDAKTKRRYKKGVHRGRIAPVQFFKVAQDRVSKDIASELDRYILGEVEKKWNKKQTTK